MAKETIAILGGTGDLGTGLAIRWAKAGHAIIIGSRTQEKADAAVAELKRISPQTPAWFPFDWMPSVRQWKQRRQVLVYRRDDAAVAHARSLP